MKRIVLPGEKFPGEWLTPPEPGATVAGYSVAAYVNGERVTLANRADLDAGKVQEYIPFKADITPEPDWKPAEDDDPRGGWVRILRGAVEVRRVG